MKLAARRLVSGAMAAAALLAGGGAKAADWSIDRGVFARQTYTSNYFLSSQDVQSAWVSFAGGTVSARRATENTLVQADAGLNGFLVEGIPNQDSWGGNLGLVNNYATERATYGLSLQYARASTFQSELLTTGVVLTRVPRTSVSILPSVQYALTERWLVNASALASRLSYSGSGSSLLQDNETLSGTVGTTYQYSAETQFTLTATRLHYETLSNSSSTDSNTMQLLATHRFSSRLTSSLGIGRFYRKRKLTRA